MPWAESGPTDWNPGIKGGSSRVNLTHPGFAQMRVEMDVEDALSRGADVVNELHGGRHSLRADPGADVPIADVLRIGDRMITIEQNQLGVA